MWRLNHQGSGYWGGGVCAPQLLAKRQSGCAILFISADLDEVLSIADRVGVIYNGRIVAEFRPEEVTAEELGVYMLGGKKKAGGAA